MTGRSIDNGRLLLMLLLMLLLLAVVVVEVAEMRGARSAELRLSRPMGDRS
jgi:hypothetical protein